MQQISAEAFLLAYVALLTIASCLGVAILSLMASASKNSGASIIVNNYNVDGDSTSEEEDDDCYDDDDESYASASEVVEDEEEDEEEQPRKKKARGRGLFKEQASAAVEKDE